MISLSEELQIFLDLLKELRGTTIQLKKYNSNSYYKNKFLSKIKEINRSYKFLRIKIKKSSNHILKSKFRKIEGDIDTIIEYENPDSCLEVIDNIESFWPEIEIALEDDSEKFDERIYDMGNRFDFHLDIKSILNNAKRDLFIVDSWVNEDILELYLKNLPKGVKIRILSGANPKGKLVKVSNMFTSQFGNILEIKENPSVHDRSIFCDSDIGWVMGQSIKDGGKKPTYIIKLRDSRRLKSIYEEIWLHSKKIV